MNAVFLSPVGVIGGAERVLLHVLDAVGSSFPEAPRTLIQLGDGPLKEAAERLGVGVIVEPATKSFASVGDTRLRASEGRARALVSVGASMTRAAPDLYRLVARLKRRLKALRPTVVHSNGMKAHLLARLATPRGVRRLMHLHDFFSHRPLVRKALPFLVQGVECGVAISHAVADDARSVVPSLPVAVVHNAVDTDHFSPGPSSAAELDRLAGLPAAARDVLRVGLVATYADWKGHHVFLNALAKVAGVRGYVVGGPIYATAGSQVTLDELQSAAAALGLSDRVGFLPFQRDPIDVYRGLDVVVHASTRPEPFGLTVAEAMSVGKPVVVAAAGGAAELFTDESDALGHAPGEVDSLARRIQELAADAGLRRRLGTNARETALQRFSLDRFHREIAWLFAGRPATR
jgi:glycosyltransferase involved in cell wall biosynthesis